MNSVQVYFMQKLPDQKCKHCIFYKVLSVSEHMSRLGNDVMKSNINVTNKLNMRA